MPLLKIDALRGVTVTNEPFANFVLESVIDPRVQDALLADYPVVRRGGSFPLESVKGGPLFNELVGELLGDTLRGAFADRFGMDLHGRPATLTVRGRCRRKDGQIHVDSKSKLVTVLLYLNEPWNSAGGRLRLLHDGASLDHSFAEVSPQFGTLVAFVNGPTAWHGHGPYEGVRRVLQLNYVTDEAAARRSARRHGFSALVKRLNPFARAA